MKLGFLTEFSKVENMNHIFYKANSRFMLNVLSFSKRNYSKKNLISIPLNEIDTFDISYKIIDFYITKSKYFLD